MMKFFVIEDFLNAEDCRNLINDAKIFTKNIDFFKYHGNREDITSSSLAYSQLLLESVNWKNLANKINSEFKKNNIDAIIDDTDENFSSKIKKMNLIGAPYQIIIGKQTEGDLIEFKEVGKETKKLKIAEIIEIIKKQKEKN